MATIAKLMVDLGMNSAAFTKGAREAQSVFGKLQKSFSGLTGVIAAGAAAFGAYKAVGFVEAQMKAIDVNAKVSDSLGIQMEKLIAIQHAGDLAGAGVDEVNTALGKMVKSFDGPEKAQAAFDKLGLSADELRKKDPGEAFKTIAESFKNLDAVDRANVAVDIFGKAGQKLIPLMLGGADAINKAAAETVAYGTAISRVDAAQVEAANDAWTRAKAALTGVATQLAVGLAPVLEAAANKFTEMATSGGGIKEKVGPAIEYVAGGIASIADGLQFCVAAFQTFEAIGQGAMGGVLKAIGFVDQAIRDMYAYMNNTPKTQSGIGLMADNMIASAGKSLDKAQKNIDALFQGKGESWGDKLMAKFRDINNASKANAAAAAGAKNPVKDAADDIADAVEKLDPSAEKLKGIFASLQDDITTFFMTDKEKKVFEIQTLGATPDDVARLKIMIDTLANLRKEADKTKKAADALKDMYEEGARLTESLRTKDEKFSDEMDKLNRMLMSGAIDVDVYALAVAAAKKELEGLAEGLAEVQERMGRASEASQVERLAIAAMARRSREANGVSGPKFITPAALFANRTRGQNNMGDTVVNRPSPGSKSVAEATKKVIEVKGMDRVISLLGDIAVNTGNFTVLS